MFVSNQQTGIQPDGDTEAKCKSCGRACSEPGPAQKKEQCRLLDLKKKKNKRFSNPNGGVVNQGVYIKAI